MTYNFLGLYGDTGPKGRKEFIFQLSTWSAINCGRLDKYFAGIVFVSHCNNLCSSSRGGFDQIISHTTAHFQICRVDEIIDFS